MKNFLKTGNFEGKAEQDFFGNIRSPFRLVNNKVIVPSDEEIERNPRSRSAKLRLRSWINRVCKLSIEKSMAMETKQKKKKKENRFSFLYILGGGILKEDFIVRHTKMIVLVVVLIFIFIGNRYVCNATVA